MPTVSIIICTRNRAATLQKMLMTLDGVLPPDDPAIEIIVVDNGSTDDTSLTVVNFAATRSGVKYVREPQPGKSLALNHGAAEAKGELLAWLDDDTFPQPGWLEELIRPIVEDKSDVVVGRVLLPPYLLRDWMTPELRQRYGEMPWADGGTFPLGGNLAITRKLYDKSPGFDPHLGPGGIGLGTHEDTLLALQLMELGARVGYADKAAVEHHFDVSRLKRKFWLEAAIGQGRSSAYVYHHWDHDKIRMPLVRRWRKQVQLSAWRRSHKPNLDPESEGVSLDELSLVQQIAFFRQYRIEAGKPYNYEQKCGVRRRSAGGT